MKAVIVSDRAWRTMQDMINAYLLRCALEGELPLPGRSLAGVVNDLKQAEVRDMGTDDERPRLCGEVVADVVDHPYLMRK
jgi:hypothetical protein